MYSTAALCSKPCGAGAPEAQHTKAALWAPLAASCLSSLFEGTLVICFITHEALHWPPVFLSFLCALIPLSLCKQAKGLKETLTEYGPILFPTRDVPSETETHHNWHNLPGEVRQVFSWWETLPITLSMYIGPVLQVLRVHIYLFESLQLPYKLFPLHRDGLGCVLRCI